MSSKFRPVPTPVSYRIALRDAKVIWRKACQFEGVPVGAAAVELSEENPYAQGYYRAMDTVMRYMNRP